MLNQDGYLCWACVAYEWLKHFLALRPGSPTTASTSDGVEVAIGRSWSGLYVTKSFNLINLSAECGVGQHRQGFLDHKG